MEIQLHEGETSSFILNFITKNFYYESANDASRYDQLTILFLFIVS
jgi:hypothetical protein